MYVFVFKSTLPKSTLVHYQITDLKTGCLKITDCFLQCL